MNNRFIQPSVHLISRTAQRFYQQTAIGRKLEQLTQRFEKPLGITLRYHGVNAYG